MRRQSKIAAGVLAFALLFPLASQAALYKWVDDKGNVTYSQLPPPDQKGVQTIRTQRGPTPPPAKPKPEKEETATEKEASGKGAGKSEQDLNAIRKQNCDAAKKNLEIYTTFRRVQDDKGEVTTLDDDTRAAKIRDAEKDIKQFCTQ